MLFYLILTLCTVAVIGPNYFFSETYYIKMLAPKINDGLKELLELVLLKKFHSDFIITFAN